MKKKHILVAEDDETISELIRYNLEKHGFRVSCYASGEKVLLHAGADMPELILLDILLPGIDGIQVCRLLRAEEKTRAIPIIMVTAKGEEQDIVEGLEAGADDYITKPFSPRVLLARLGAVLRRGSREGAASEKTARPIQLRELSIDPQRYRVTVAGKRLDLTVTEYQILVFLAGRAGWVFTRQQIVEAVRGGDYHVTDRAVDVAIFGLRKKLGEYGGYVETVRGIGYRFVDENEENGA
jgi:two-component system alkaline phosphatase synthesis response regulator PhoP